MSVPSPFFINSFSSIFLLITFQVFCYCNTLSGFGGLTAGKLPTVKPKLNSAIGVDSITVC